MSLIKKILSSVYDIAPLLLLRTKVRRKINSILSQSELAGHLSAVLIKQQEMLHQINHQTSLISHQTSLQNHQINLENNQLDFLRVASNKQDSIHEKLDFHNNVLAQIQTEAIIKHDAQIKHLENISSSQGFSALFRYRDEHFNQFSEVIKRILRDGHPNLTSHLEEFFTEIFIGHMRPGGMWELKRDLFSFIDQSSLIKQEAPLQSLSGCRDTPLNILVVSGTFPSLLHGGGGRLLDIIVELSGKHHVDLFSHYIENLDFGTLEFLKDKVDNIKLVTDYDDFTVEQIGTWLRSINRDTSFYDIVQLEYPQTIRFINPIRQYGKKVGYTFMESLALSHSNKLEDTIKNSDYDNITKYSRSCWQSIADEKYAMLNADFCIAVTDNDADFLNRLDNRKVNIIPTCVSTFAIINELEKYKEIVPEENSVCFLGFFGHWPNIEAMEWYLKDIHALVKKAIPDYRFNVVGSGDISSIKRISEGDQNVIVVGQVDSIVPHLLKSKVCISPLISGAGIRGKQNQYSLVGRPSVTTSIGNKGLEYVHEESVMIADKADDFATSIIKLLTDEQLYKKIQENSRMIAIENYSWKKHIDKLLSIYREE